MKAVILAAGYATRLYPLTLNTPKCLLKVHQRSLLDRLCAKLDLIPIIDEMIVVTNARFFDQLNEWKKRSKFRCSVRVLNDGTLSNETRLGAVGDLGYALSECSIRRDVLLLASDNLFEAGLEPFVRFALAKKDAVSVGLYDIKDPRLAAKRFGVLQINKGLEVVGMEEKPDNPKSSLIGMGVYFFPRRTLRYVRRYLRQKSAKDAPGYYLQWLLGKIKIYGFLFDGLWYDIGDLSALEEARRVFK